MYCLTESVSRVVSGDDITFSGNSISGKPFSITVKVSDANAWINGNLIQSCFPYLSADDREILKTGIDGETWDEMFGGLTSR